MKRIIALGLALLAAAAMLCSCGGKGVKIDEKHFPDNNFRGYVLKEFDINGDRYLDDEEVSIITEIDFTGESIKTLKGIEHFTSLIELDCRYNQLTSLDVSKCTSLEYLWCHSNRLTALDVSKCSALKVLWCYENQLTSLDVNECTSLETLLCYKNQLTSLDVKGCAEDIDISADDGVEIIR